MKNLALLLIILINLKQASAQEFGTLKDARDGKVYKTVQIGEQVWMAENLNVTKFRNGDPIPEAKTYKEWKSAAIKKKPIWCYYNFNPANGSRFGRLYNWYATKDPRGLAIENWHIPSFNEWIRLKNYTKNDENSLRSKNSWKDNAAATNSSGFSGLGGGFYIKGFGWLGESVYFWITFDEKSIDDIQFWIGYPANLGYGVDLLEDLTIDDLGFYVRCIKD